MFLLRQCLLLSLQLNLHIDELLHLGINSPSIMDSYELWKCTRLCLMASHAQWPQSRNFFLMTAWSFRVLFTCSNFTRGDIVIHSILRLQWMIGELRCPFEQPKSMLFKCVFLLSSFIGTFQFNLFILEDSSSNMHKMYWLQDILICYKIKSLNP